MKLIHRTANGETMLISKMTDLHLHNTVMMHLRRIVKFKDPEDWNLSEFELGLINPDEDEDIDELMSPMEKGRMVNQALDELAPYLIEMFARSQTNEASRIVRSLISPKSRPEQVTVHRDPLEESESY